MVTEIETTKEMSENMFRPGIEPGSPGGWSDALQLNQPHHSTELKGPLHGKLWGESHINRVTMLNLISDLQ